MRSKVKPKGKAAKRAIAKKTTKKVVAKKRSAKRQAPKKKPIKKALLKKRVPKRPPRKVAVKKSVKKKPVIQKKIPRRKLKEEFVQKMTQGLILEQEEVERKRVTYPIVEWAQSERVKMVAGVLRELQRKKAISDWRINFLHERSANLYVGSKLEIETQLEAMREDVHVTVYARFADGTIGEASVPILTDDPALTREQIADAASICTHARKKAYPLPQPEEVEFPKGHDERMLTTFTQGAAMSIPLRLYEAMREALAGTNVRTNCAEVLTSAMALRVLSSSGIDVSFHKTRVYVELTLSASEGKQEQEFHWYTTQTSPEQLDLRGAIEQQVQIAHDAVRAQSNPGFTGDVLLAGRSLLDFFVPGDGHTPIILHAHAKLRLMGLSQLTLGAPLGTFSGEPFTISSDPTLPMGLLTAPVDDEGVPLRPLEIVRTGIFTNYIAQPKYAHQLGLPVTGEMSNVRIGDGATREEHLRGHNYFEIVAFSWFNPDPFSGEFSAEIRLGYLWERGRKTPVRGGTFTGNVFSNLLAARFSREAMQSGRYYGPRAMLFKSAIVTKR